ncbi:MAG: type IV pili methyl-accepting chemotaxis transducer N-terminal domain-containing protein [Phycisphaerales bacterium]
MLNTLVVAAFVCAASPSTDQIAATLNLAGQQRTLTQQIAKDYLLIASDQNPETNREALSRDMEAFEATISALENGEVCDSARADVNLSGALKALRSQWGQIKPTFTAVAAGGPTSPQATLMIAESSGKLLDTAEKVFALCLAHSQRSTTAGPVLASISAACKQQLLSQKLAKEYLLVHLNVNVEHNRDNLRESARQFESLLSALTDGDATLGVSGATDPTLRDQLAAVSELWGNLSPTISSGLNGSTSAAGLASVASQSLPILNNLGNALNQIESGLIRTGTFTNVNDTSEDK